MIRLTIDSVPAALVLSLPAILVLDLLEFMVAHLILPQTNLEQLGVSRKMCNETHLSNVQLPHKIYCFILMPQFLKIFVGGISFDTFPFSSTSTFKRSFFSLFSGSFFAGKVRTRVVRTFSILKGCGV